MLIINLVTANLGHRIRRFVYRSEGDAYFGNLHHSRVRMAFADRDKRKRKCSCQGSLVEHLDKAQQPIAFCPGLGAKKRVGQAATGRSDPGVEVAGDDMATIRVCPNEFNHLSMLW